MRKPFFINIWQTLPLRKILKTIIFAQKSPRGGGRGDPQATEKNEVKRIKRQQHQKMQQGLSDTHERRNPPGLPDTRYYLIRPQRYLLLVAGNPLQDIKNLRRVSKVITNGRMFDSRKLGQSVGFHR